MLRMIPWLLQVYNKEPQHTELPLYHGRVSADTAHLANISERDLGFPFLSVV